MDAKDQELNPHKICVNHRYGEHIELTCKNHPEKKWSTKNIDYIGARSIFFNLNNAPMGLECNCPVGDLIHRC